MTLGGRGTGGLTSHDIEELRKEARKRLEQSREDARINSFLQQLLTEFNSRDVEQIGDYLSEIERALRNESRTRAVVIRWFGCQAHTRRGIERCRCAGSSGP